ncbi:MAG TPA: hypothetical protein VFW44_17695 [Bryobacteraceae bacterium]|nr:hypothetical protein [Bryobacteraceae bacterium]
MLAIRKILSRQVLISTLILAAVPPSVVRASSDTVQYVGGTVKSIPVNSDGTLSFEDAKEFRFLYNGSVFKLPYDQITSTSIEKADVRRVWHVFPAMSPIAAHRKQTLVINYTDASGATGSVNFELAAYKAMDAQETIAAKRSPITPAAAAAASNEWWGDRYWKTNRNKPAWDAAAAQTAAPQNTQASAPVQPGQLSPGGTK